MAKLSASLKTAPNAAISIVCGCDRCNRKKYRVRVDEYIYRSYSGAPIESLPTDPSIDLSEQPILQAENIIVLRVIIMGKYEYEFDAGQAVRSGGQRGKQ